MIKPKRGRPAGTAKHLQPTTINGKVVPVYHKYCAMLARCSNRNHQHWDRYGGRGITVCDRWLGKDGYDNFVSDMGVPLPGFTLDRIDNNGGYSPDNCRWATMQEQANNRQHCGPAINPDSLRQKCIRAGQPYMLVILRIRRGWSEQRALETPKMKLGRQPAIAPVLPV